MFSTTASAKESESDNIYYVEHPFDEYIAVSRVLANHEEDFKIRYLVDNADLFDGIAFDPFYYMTYYHYTTTMLADCSYGLLNWSQLKYNVFYFGTAEAGKLPYPIVVDKGQEWYEVDYGYLYNDNHKEYETLYKEVRKLILDSKIATASDYDKVKWIYNWMADNIRYYPAWYNNGAYDTFIEKNASDDGFVELFSVFANELGLDTRIVFGDVKIGSKVRQYTWNIVKLDDKWYQVDTRLANLEGEKYLLKGTDSFSEHHTIEDALLKLNLNLSASDCTGSTQNSGVPARLYGIVFDNVNVERLNINESYQWLISNPDKISLELTNSNPEIASLDKNGKVIGLKEGKTTLTAVNKELGINQSCEITVSLEKAVEGKTVTKIASAKDVKVKFGETAQINLMLLPKNGMVENIKYTSADKSIATVDKNGKLKGVKAGTTYVTISYTGGDKVKVKVTVNPVVNKKTATVQVKKQINLRDAIVISKNGYKDLKFTSSNKSIVTVSATGYVTGVKKGTATINVYDKNTNKLVGAVKVTVK